MKLPRNARIFRSQLDLAAFASVFFLLILFLLVGSAAYTPGVHLNLPVADNLPGTDKPTVSVAVDSNGRFYFEHHLVEEKELEFLLRREVKSSGAPLVLIMQADEKVPCSVLVHLTLLARNAGISEALLATLPPPLSTAGGP
ncbi:MAG TPA: biopolymer transporter ExbD [Verrucomicrobiae bacterium]|nr:biopolymer transporter ExbD [Verrucomicrobiae bacterium]